MNDEAIQEFHRAHEAFVARMLDSVLLHMLEQPEMKPLHAVFRNSLMTWVLMDALINIAVATGALTGNLPETARLMEDKFAQKIKVMLAGNKPPDATTH